MEERRGCVDDVSFAVPPECRERLGKAVHGVVRPDGTLGRSSRTGAVENRARIFGAAHEYRRPWGMIGPLREVSYCDAGALDRAAVADEGEGSVESGRVEGRQ